MTCFSTSTIGSPKTDSTKYYVTAEQILKMKMITVENQDLKERIKSYILGDTALMNEVNKLRQATEDCNEFKHVQEQVIRKFEMTPREVITYDTRKWYEAPLYVTLGVVAGVVIKTLLLK